MQANQLKALIEQGITEFAISPTPITNKLGHSIPATVTDIKRNCPVGLVEAKVVEDGHKWIEKYTFGCGGDQVHETPRRNGVLVEFALEPASIRSLNDDQRKRFEKLREKGRPLTDFYDDEKIDDAQRKFLLDISSGRWIKTEHAEVFLPDGKVANKMVRLVVARRAIVVPWAEYAMVLAEREKVRLEAERRAEINEELAVKLRTPGKGDGPTKYPDDMRWSRWTMRFEAFWSNRKDKEARQHDDFNREYADHVGLGQDWGAPRAGAFFVTYEMPMFHAKKIVDVLDAVRSGDIFAARAAIAVLDAEVPTEND